MQTNQHLFELKADGKIVFNFNAIQKNTTLKKTAQRFDESKLLLLRHVFETLEFNRVEFFIDSRNSRSRSAVKKLGATEEGILRQHVILEDGYVRDTVVCSILKKEWPKILLTLENRLNNL